MIDRLTAVFVPDEHVPEDGEVTVVAVFNWREKHTHTHTHQCEKNKARSDDLLRTDCGTFCDTPGVLPPSDSLAVHVHDGVASDDGQRQLVLWEGDGGNIRWFGFVVCFLTF